MLKEIVRALETESSRLQHSSTLQLTSSVFSRASAASAILASFCCRTSLRHENILALITSLALRNHAPTIYPYR
jgi:hypothetical protein